MISGGLSSSIRTDIEHDSPISEIKKVSLPEPVKAIETIPIEPAVEAKIEAPVVPIATVSTSSSDVETIVREAARKYGIDENYFVHIAMCESTMNPSSVNTSYYENGNPSGIFQHISGYYPARAAKYGYSPDVFDAYSNANVTAAMFADGHQNLWQCN